MANKHKKKKVDLKPRWLPISDMGIHGDVKYNRRKAKQELSIQNDYFLLLKKLLYKFNLNYSP